MIAERTCQKYRLEGRVKHSGSADEGSTQAGQICYHHQPRPGVGQRKPQIGDTTTAIMLGVIVVLVLAGVVYNNRSNAALAAFGGAVQTYQTPVVKAGQAVPPGVEDL